MQIVLDLWKELIEIQDNKYIFYLSIALIMLNRSKILNSNRGDLPYDMASLTIANKMQLKEVIALAHKVKSCTPISFIDSPQMNMLFGSKAAQNFKTLGEEHKIELHLKLESLLCLPIQPSEFFKNIFPSNIKCKVPTCFNAHAVLKAKKLKEI